MWASAKATFATSQMSNAVAEELQDACIVFLLLYRHR
jgi:hypothetical protein